MKKTWSIFLSLAMVLCLGLAVLTAQSRQGAVAAAEIPAFVRTDSLTAQNEDGTAKVAEGTTAALVDRTVVGGGTIKALSVGAGEEAILDFDLPDDTTSGSVILFGDNLNTATVGIWVGETSSWFDNSAPALIGESSANGAVKVNFADSAWLDAGRKVLRVRVTGGTDAALFSAAVLPDSVIPVIGAGEQMTLSHLSFEQLAYVIYLGGGANGLGTFLNNGAPVMHTVGPAIFNVYVSAGVSEIAVDYAVLADGQLRVRDASASAGANGDPAAFTAIENGAALDLSGYGTLTYDGQTCYLLQFIAYNGANAFLDFFTVRTTAAPDQAIISMRTDSLTASAEQASILSVSGADVVLDAQEGTVPGEQNYNNVLRFDEASEEAVFEFNLPNTSTGGQVRLFGSNLDALKVGIWNPADGSWYHLADAAYQGDSKYGVLVAGFGNTTWYDAGQKIIRLRLWEVSGEARLHRITVVDGVTPVLGLDESLTVGHLTAEESLYALYYGNGLKTYFNDKAEAGLHLNPGMAIWELKVTASANFLHVSLDAMTPTGFGLRDASQNAAPDGNPADYIAVQSGSQIDLSGFGILDPDGQAGSGDEYYLVHLFGWNAGDSILRSFTVQPIFNDAVVTFEAMDNANSGVPEQTYTWFAVGSEEEKQHYFADASLGSDYEAIFEAGNQGLVPGTANGGSFATRNARQFTIDGDQAQSLIYEFRLPAATQSAVIKVYGTSGYRLIVHTQNSIYRQTLLPDEAMGANTWGLAFYTLDESFFTAGDGVIRVELVAEAKNQQIFGISVQTGETLSLEESVQIAPFSEESYLYAVSATQPNLYYLNSDVPSWYLVGGSSITYRVQIPDEQDTLLVAATASGAIGVEVSTDGALFENLFTVNNNGGGITATEIGEVDVSSAKTVWIRTTGGPGFLVYLNLSYPAEAGTVFTFDTFTADEFSHIADLSAADPSSPVPYGYVGLSHRDFSRTGRRIGFMAAAPEGASIVYAFDFDASAIWEEDGQNKLYLNLRAIFGTYNIWISDNLNFTGNVVTASGSAPRDLVLDASSVLTQTVAADGIKTIYVKISHNNAEPDTNMGGGLDFIFESLGMYADGSKGSGWPNDSNFDYDDAPDYEHNPGLPALPEDPEPVTGTENFGGQSCVATGAGSSLLLCLVVGGAAVIFFKKGGKRV